MSKKLQRCGHCGAATKHGFPQSDGRLFCTPDVGGICKSSADAERECEKRRRKSARVG